MIPYGRQYIDDEDIEEVVRVLRSDYITQGPKVREFEEKLADFCGARFAVVFNSGTSALIAAYYAVGLLEGDEFVTSPITFVATANAGLHLGARPVFVDVESDTGNMDVRKIENALTERTKLIVPVHYGGHPADLEGIREIAKRYNLKVVEDACHALGASYRGHRIGSCAFSDATVFSFHPVKHITTGEGGAVLTNDEEVYEKLLLFREHGIRRNVRKEEPWYYECLLLGYNFRMTDIQAALGISQLRKLPRFVERRRKIAEIYNEAFRNNPHFDTPVERDYAFNSYHLYPIRFKEKGMRDRMFVKLRNKGIGVQVHYIPVYWHPLYQRLGYEKGMCPVAEEFYSGELSLPMHVSITEEEVFYTIREVSNG